LKAKKKFFWGLQQKIVEINKHFEEMYKAIEDIKKLVEVEKQGMKEVQLEIIAKVDAQITSHN
jgi:hypothetical protein